MIIQGSNEPIYLVFIDEKSVEDITDFSAKLFVDGVLQKSWSKSDVTIKDNVVTLGLTQQETIAFDIGFATLEAKYLDADGNVINAGIADIKIDDRFDEKILGGSTNADS